MPIRPQLAPTTTANAHEGVFAEIAEEVWRDCGSSVSRDDVRSIVGQALDNFADARITLYLPILVRRRVKEKLARMSSRDAGAAAPASIGGLGLRLQGVEAI